MAAKKNHRIYSELTKRPIHIRICVIQSPDAAFVELSHRLQKKRPFDPILTPSGAGEFDWIGFDISVLDNSIFDPCLLDIPSRKAADRSAAAKRSERV